MNRKKGKEKVKREREIRSYSPKRLRPKPRPWRTIFTVNYFVLQ